MKKPANRYLIDDLSHRDILEARQRIILGQTQVENNLRRTYSQGGGDAARALPGVTAGAGLAYAINSAKQILYSDHGVLVQDANGNWSYYENK